MAKEAQQLGKYRILEELGRGGFATVYRALDTTLEREVALKVLDPLLMRDETWVERFHREAKAVARLNHPSIVTIYEIGEAGDRLFIAMKLIEGPELGDLIAKRGRLPWGETLRVLAQVTNALSYAHGKEIIHRDLKPANILIDEQRGAVLTDFGFARLVSESSMSVSVSGGIVGTPQYIAPEIWDGESASLQTDVYALACIVYEMMTGQALFEGATPAVVMRKHLIDGPRFPEKWPKGVPPGVKSVLEKALAQDPDERYASAGAFAADLQNMTGQTPDPLAEPYKGLKAALSGGRWDFALRRADEIMAQDPEYRDVQALRKRAAEGKAAAERAQRAAQWREQALEAERRGDVEAARVATQRWLDMAPGDADAEALLDRINKASARRLASGQSYAAEELDSVSSVAGSVQSDLPPEVREDSQRSVRKPVPGWVWGIISGGGLLVLLICLGVALGPRLFGASSEPTEPSGRTPNPTPSPTTTSLTSTPAPVLIGTPVSQSAATISPENVGRLIQLARWGKGSVQDATYSPEGTLVAAASSLGIYIYDGQTLEEIRFIETDALIISIAFSPDGKILISGSDDATVRLWRVSDGALLCTLKGHTDYVQDVAFSPDGAILASGSGDTTVRLWRVSDGTLLHTLEGHEDGVYGVDFGSDGSTLISMSDSDTRVWRVSDGALLNVLERYEDGGYDTTALSSDGKVVASVSEDTVQVWRISDGMPLHTLERSEISGRDSVALSPDGAILALTSGNNVQLWRVSDGVLLSTLEAHEDSVYSVAFSPDGETLASGAADKTVKLWRVPDGQLLHSTKGSFVIAFSPDGTTLLSSSKDTTLRLWRVSDGALLSTVEGHTCGVADVAFSPDGAALASGELCWPNGVIRLWRVRNGGPLYAQSEAATEDIAEVLDVAFSPDGTMLASIDYFLFAGSLRLWQANDGTPLSRLATEGSSVAFAPDGEALAAGDSKGMVRLLRVSDGALMRTLEGHSDSVNSVAFSPDGTTMASGSDDNTVRLWRVSDGALLHTLELHRGGVKDVAFSPDGAILASGSVDHTVWLWEVANGTSQSILKAHTDYVQSLAFSPDGEVLASGSDDDTVRLWRISSGALVGTLEGHTASVSSVAFSPDGEILASGSRDGTVRLWGVPQE